ncbi:MAG TPA: VOC family protein [Nitrososphaeraceae archaeon]|nr:VOC family protein [Nitrososphaeraceae archaeon]
MHQIGKSNHNEERNSTFKINQSTKIGYVSLNVSDIQNSLEFYQSILGFRQIQKKSCVAADRAYLSTGGTQSSIPMLELVQTSQTDSNLANSRRAGLYHFAILLPERKNLADVLLYLSDKQDKIRFDGLADHLVSESLYIRDPDFIGIEIYSDRPQSEWKWNDENDNKNNNNNNNNNRQLQMATLPLNTDNLLKEATDKGWIGMPTNTMIGHVHLHVRDLSNAMNFYRDILGLNLTTTNPGAYFFAAGRYHHHIATNTWLGTNILPASPKSIGLNHFSIELPSKEEFDRTFKQLQHQNIVESNSEISSKAIFIRDPNGIRISLSYGRITIE